MAVLLRKVVLMPAVFPSSVKVFTTKADLVDTVLADHVNTLQDEVTAVETTLGTGILSSTWGGTYTNPSTHASVQSRIANIESGLVSLASSKADSSTAVTLTGTQTLTNKTLTAPVISSISNSGTLTLPTGTDTLVGRATVDTLTNKTLTSPTINGATIGGAFTSTATITGGTINPNTLQQGGVAAVTVSGTQTLTNKTLTAPVISTISNTGTLTLPTSTDTLVGRDTTDTLTNKTLTSPTINGATLSGTLTSTATLSGGTVNPTTLQQGGIAAVTISGTQTLTNKTLTSPVIGSGATFNGATSGTTVLAATATASGTLTLPAATDTLVGKATTDVLTNKTLTSLRETALVSATAASGTVTLDLATAGVVYYTTNATANFTLNFRWNSGTTLNTAMATGESISIVFLCTNGATAYYASAFQIDGVAVTPKYQFGTAFTQGSASAIDAYTITIFKTGASTYTVFAGQTKWA